MYNSFVAICLCFLSHTIVQLLRRRLIYRFKNELLQFEILCEVENRHNLVSSVIANSQQSRWYLSTAPAVSCPVVQTSLSQHGTCISLCGDDSSQISRFTVEHSYLNSAPAALEQGWRELRFKYQ